MNYIALILALAAERIAPQFMQLREVPGLGSYARHVVSHTGTGVAGGGWLPGIFFASLPATLVLIVGEGIPHGLGTVLYAAVALVLSLGPQDLFDQVREYLTLARGNSDQAGSRAAELLEHDAGQRSGSACEEVGDAVFVQANNRLFGVLFWFAVFGTAGAAGAVLFRTTDVLRREAIRASQGRAAGTDPCLAVLQRIHGALAWAPARLLATTYGIAGSFDDAFRGWRSYLLEERDDFFEANDWLLVHAGQGALGAPYAAAPDEAARAELALSLVRRSLYVWLAVLAAIYLFGATG